jgi:hypothetical protein
MGIIHWLTGWEHPEDKRVPEWVHHKIERQRHSENLIFNRRHFRYLIEITYSQSWDNVQQGNASGEVWKIEYFRKGR